MTDIEIPLGKRTFWYRFFEILPGFLSITILVLPIVLSLIDPLLGAGFVIIFMIAWLIRALATAFRTIQGHKVLTSAQKVNWRQRLDDLNAPEKALKVDNFSGWHSRRHKRNLKRVAESQEAKYPKPINIYNAVIIATYNESQSILEPTILSILQGDYDHKNTILMIAYEERGGPTTKATAELLIKKYASKFYHAEAVGHPDGITGEVIGKGGNITWAGRRLEKWLKSNKVNPDNVIVTTLDADNRPHETYFSYLTYEYILHPNRHHLSFQPVALFLNNIWDVPAPMRVVATGNSFFNIVMSQRPHLLRNFASHSQGMGALIDTDFWSVRTIVEDGHQYWRSYFRFDGNYEVVPVYVPIYQDAVLSETTKKTLKAQFVQVRRWAYGASDIAYVATRGFRKTRTVKWLPFLSRLIRLIDNHVSWAAAALVVAVGAWAPLLLNSDASRSIVAHELPTLASNLQRIAMIGLFVMVFLSFKMLPPRPARYKRRRTFWMLLQWVMMPVIGFAYGAAAALYSQTRLLAGNYMDKFDATEKAVIKADGTASKV